MTYRYAKCSIRHVSTSIVPVNYSKCVAYISYAHSIKKQEKEIKRYVADTAVVEFPSLKARHAPQQTQVKSNQLVEGEDIYSIVKVMAVKQKTMDLTIYQRFKSTT